MAPTQLAGLIEDVAAQSKHTRASTAGKAGGVSRPRNSLVAAASSKLKPPTERVRAKLSKRARTAAPAGQAGRRREIVDRGRVPSGRRPPGAYGPPTGPPATPSNEIRDRA